MKSVTSASIKHLRDLCRLVRYWILLATTQAGSGHPSSSLSSVELMVGLFFGGILRYDLNHPRSPANDRVIFSKGHASPLLYALFAAAGALSETDLVSLRHFGSPLEGHPTPRFPHVEAATGSLGQGLSIAVGMAIHAKYIHTSGTRFYVLLGDSEMTEGSIWEAIQIAAHYQLSNLFGIIDVNRLGQRGETLYSHDLEAYRRRIAAFGWRVITIDGHHLPSILRAFHASLREKQRPTMIIAKTVKGKGVPIMEDQNGWHGKVLTKDQFRSAKDALGKIDRSIRGRLRLPGEGRPQRRVSSPRLELNKLPVYRLGQQVATRTAFATGLVRVANDNPTIILLDAEVKNSTRSEIFEDYFPDRFFEMYIAEQNMVSVALGLALRGNIPFVSTFAAFMTRAFDQIRMAQYSNPNIKFVGSHVGVSVGEDGPSQMGLEDITMFRTIHRSVILYPSDAISCQHLVAEASRYSGIVYLRTTRMESPVIYREGEEFPIGGSKIVKRSEEDRLTVVAAGITLHEALKAWSMLQKSGINIRVIDLYSIKPLDRQTLQEAARETRGIVVVEDHHPEGGIAEAVRSTLTTIPIPVYSLSVRRDEVSGTPEELLDFQDISARDIVSTAKTLLR